MDQIPVYLVLALPIVAALAMFALGIVVIFQASRVLNLAHGAMAMVPPFLLFELSRRGVPLLVALAVALAGGALIGAVVERVFVRTLRRQGPTGQTVGTVAALGLLMAAAVKIWGTTPRTPVRLFPSGGIAVGASVLTWSHIGLCVIAVAATAGFFALFRFTNLGLAMRLAADNRRAASLMGIDPDVTTRTAWLIGGALAGITGILMASITTLHPVNLSLVVLPAFVAALIGGLSSLFGALAGAAVVGLVQGMVPALGLVPGIGNLARQPGVTQLVLTVLALVVMSLRGSRFVGADVRADLGEPVTLQAPRDEEGSQRRGPQAGSRTAGALLLAVALLGWPFLGVNVTWLNDGINACTVLIVGVSLVLLTGWVGQISLAHASFVGLGAFSTALAARNWGVPFPVSLPLAALVAGGVAAVLGVVALRVRGLYLAVATLIFLWMSSEFLFNATWLTGGGAILGAERIGTPRAVPYFDFTDRRTLYFVALAVAAATLWAAVNLRDSKTGRAFFAVRGSETAAASLGIDVTRYKLLAFAISGALAGVAGNLYILKQASVTGADFTFAKSLFYLSVAVVGGLTSVGGAIGAAIGFALLDELFYRVGALAGWLDVVSAALLAVVLLLRPGGLASLAATFRPAGRLLGRLLGPVTRPLDAAGAGLASGLRSLGKRLRPARVTGETAPAPAPVPGRRPLSLPPARADRAAVLAVSDLTVAFGGLRAVEDVSLTVHEGEIVGLIGPNGAGKTTTFNAISGLAVPTSGTVWLFGRDVTGWPVHERAKLGVARTFQVIQLFPQLTVFDNLLVATHLQNRSGVFSHVVVTRPSLIAEHEARVRARDAIELLGLHDVAGRPVAGLPFGVLRMVELARALVTGASLVMLDEPASGLDNAETEHLAELLRHIRDERGTTILLIEHDVPMVTSVSDYLYVIDRGRPLAEGTPAEVQANPDVVAAYLGRAPDTVGVPA